ncbi:MAG: anti-sigma factor [Congregibacter sp.]
MNYEKPEMLDHLAAAYVLGTLKGPARRRFTRLATESTNVRRAVWRWERQLLPLSSAIEERTPPAAVWQEIQRRLGFTATPVHTGRLWPALSAGLALAVLALLLPLIQSSLQPPDTLADSAAEKLAYIQSAEQQPLWVVTVDEQTGHLASIAVNVPARESDRVFQLWMLPQSGPPESFGLLPTTQNNRARMTLSPTLLALLQNAQGLAVSLEPPGGSPTGAPTGPVVYTAPVIAL